MVPFALSTVAEKQVAKLAVDIMLPRVNEELSGLILHDSHAIIYVHHRLFCYWYIPQDLQYTKQRRV